MTVNKLINIMAGFMVTLGLALAHLNGQVDLSSPSWLWLCAFVGFTMKPAMMLISLLTVIFHS